MQGHTLALYNILVLKEQYTLALYNILVLKGQYTLALNRPNEFRLSSVRFKLLMIFRLSLNTHNDLSFTLNEFHTGLVEVFNVECNGIKKAFKVFSYLLQHWNSSSLSAKLWIIKGKLQLIKYALHNIILNLYRQKRGQI